MSEACPNNSTGSSLMLSRIVKFSKKNIDEVLPEKTLAQIELNNLSEFCNFLERGGLWLEELEAELEKPMSQRQSIQKPYLVLEAQIALDKKLKLSEKFVGKPREIITVGDLMNSSLGVLTIMYSQS